MASKNIKLVTYAGSIVTPQDDALIHETAIPKSGIIYGGKTTKKTNNTLHIAAGHGIVCGRKFTISECDVPVHLTGGASHNGRVYIHMDLSNSTNPIQILIETGTQLSSEIQQKDVNILNGVYEFNLATFMVDATTIYNVVDVFPVISGKDMSELEKTFVKKRDILKTMEEVSANKDADKVVGPEAVKELSSDLGGLSFGQDADGNWGYKIGGADTVIPFSSGVKGLEVFSVTATRFTSVGTNTLTVDVPAGESLIVATVSSYDEGKDIPTCDDLEVAYLYGVKFSNEYSIAVFLCNKETSGSVTITETSTKGYNVTGAVVLYVTDRAEPSTETRSYFGFLYGGPQSRAYFAIGNATKADITVTNGQPIMVTNEVNDNSGYDGTKIATGTGTTQTVDLSAYKDSYSYLGVGGIGGAYTVTLY